MRLKELRKQLNISAKQVSKDLDIPYTTYLNYEKETREPGLRMLNKLADYFNVSVDFLLDRTPVTTVPKEKGLSDSTMGERIRELRKEKGVTQEELGKLIGVQRSAIRKYESGMVENIPRSSIQKMADFFGVSPEYLLCFSENQSKTLSEKESRLLKAYNEHPEMQHAIDTLLGLQVNEK